MKQQTWISLLFIVFVVKETSGQYVCYLCNGDASATLSNPGYVLDLSAVGIDQQATCADVQAALASGGLPTEEACNQFLTDTNAIGVQTACGCSNVAGVAPVTPAPITTSSTSAPVSSPVTSAPVIGTSAPVATPVATPAPGSVRAPQASSQRVRENGK